MNQPKISFTFEKKQAHNAYRKVSIDGIELRVAGTYPYQKIELRMVPDHTIMLTEIRVWSEGKLICVQQIKISDLVTMRY